LISIEMAMELKWKYNFAVRIPTNSHHFNVKNYSIFVEYCLCETNK